MEKIIISYYEDNAKKMRTMIDKILFRLKFNVDNEDFYSLGNEVFLDVLNRYDGKQDFDGFLYSCLVRKFKTEMTRRNRYKRQADRMAISIDSSVGEDENMTLSDIIADKATIEKIFFEENEDTYSAEMKRYLSRLSILQREVLRLISIGFNPNEILTELHINKKQYEDCYQAIHSYRNISILL